MINLLPVSEKEKIKKDYLWRLGTVALTMFAVFIFIAIIPIIISYFVMNYDVEYINKIVLDIKNGSISKEADLYSKEIKILNRKIKILNEPLNVTVRENLLSVFHNLFKKAKESSFSGGKPSPLKIISISYLQGQKKTKVSTAQSTSTPSVIVESGIHKISLKGYASKRDSLLTFLKLIEEDGNVVSVDSPVSNLVDSDNIKFNITITLKDKSV